MNNGKIGCFGTIVLLFCLAFILSYLSIIMTIIAVILSIAAICGLIYWFISKPDRDAAKLAAKEEEELNRKIATLRKYKKLLDEGIITQTEFEEKKESLNSNDLKY